MARFDRSYHHRSFGKEAKQKHLPMQPGDVPKTWADVTDIEKLGYKSSTEINKGVGQFIDWFKHYNQI